MLQVCDSTVGGTSWAPMKGGKALLMFLHRGQNPASSGFQCVLVPAALQNLPGWSTWLELRGVQPHGLNSYRVLGFCGGRWPLLDYPHCIA